MSTPFRISAKKRKDTWLENSAAFKAKIEKAQAEYAVRGGISVEALIEKLERKRAAKKS